MPSIPQSLLWISLVVLWLFVLVPMLISKRDAVRRTSDVALATRVLTSGSSARLLKRSGPATGHNSDPHWRHDDVEEVDLDEDDIETGAIATMTATTGAEKDYLDVDVVGEDPELPVGAAADGEPEAAADEPADVFETEAADDDGIDGIGGVGEAEDHDDEPATVAFTAVSPSARRRRHDSSTAAAVSARKYEFRKRVLLAMLGILMISALLAFTVASAAWWMFGATATTAVLYLGYLRRQTRIEEQVRRRRARRMARSRLGVENTADRDMDIVPARLRRPGAAVLEIDDEDPVFEHLERVAFAREQDWASSLPKAAGQ
ncbi:gephyrin-like molybdotransferase receptor GlpR [Mycolicibacillus trivialis]